MSGKKVLSTDAEERSRSVEAGKLGKTQNTLDDESATLQGGAPKLTKAHVLPFAHF